MLLPVSVSYPLRIDPSRSRSPSRPHSPTHLDEDNLFISPADILFHSRSISISPFREKSLKNDDNLEKDDVIDWNKEEEEEEYPFDDPGSGQTTAVPTRHPSPARPPSNDDDHPLIKNLPKLTRTRRRGRSTTARKGPLRLWPLIITRNPHRSPSNTSSKPWINLGPKSQDLKTVSVDVCLRWVTEEPKARYSVPPTPPPTPVEDHVQSVEDQVQSVEDQVQSVEDQVQSVDVPLSSQEKLIHIVQDVLHHAERTLDSLAVDQNNLYLHTQHYLSIADADIDEDMFLLEAKTADLEECIERIKVLRDDILYLHRWYFNSNQNNPGTFTFTEPLVFRRLRACFEPSTWWKEYDFGKNSEDEEDEVHGFESDEEESTSED